MAESTSIEWTDATVNFWWGCTKVGPGCKHCYAESWDRRTGGSHFGQGVERRKIKGAVALIHRLDNGYSWWAADAEIGRHHLNSRRRVFVQSMSDLFDLEVPVEWFEEAWSRIEICDRLSMQIVTKRISVVEKRLAAIGRTTWPQHAGLIITTVNQDEIDRDGPRLRALKERLGVSWVGLSIEPMLGPMDITPQLDFVDWVIVGGESGKGARPMHPDWVRSIRDQCSAAGVAFLFKQWGEWKDGSDFAADAKAISIDGRIIDSTPDALRNADNDEPVREATMMRRVGKKASGRTLDGVTHDKFPEALR